ncbi:uncharacterized protein LOC142886916 [Nelusetta ayraudi]|uniref:uncharacterized protein LOC142886916 n=1 Tax=Nelusetta ayraudi TaxID=303726 RepID=UPI003F72FDC2
MVTRMAGIVLGCCAVALLLHLTCVSAVQKLNNINDLKRIQFGQSLPRHSLQLLHWFANQVDKCDNEIQLNFNPNSDYGAHYYGNFERLLPHPPAGYHYYTVGNLYKEGAQQLPAYVRHQQHDNDGSNRARIIFRVYGQTIDRVYLTQHRGSDQESSYDPNHTYEIPTHLLREFSQLSRGSLEQICTSHSQSQGLLGHSSSTNHTFQPANRPREFSNYIVGVLKWALLIIVIIVIIFLIVYNGTSKH